MSKPVNQFNQDPFRLMEHVPCEFKVSAHTHTIFGPQASLIKAGEKQVPGFKTSIKSIIHLAKEALADKEANVSQLIGLATKVKQYKNEYERGLNTFWGKIYIFVMDIFSFFSGKTPSYKRELNELNAIVKSAEDRIKIIELNQMRPLETIPLPTPAPNQPEKATLSTQSPGVIEQPLSNTSSRIKCESPPVVSSFELDKSRPTLQQALESVGMLYCQSREKAEEAIQRQDVLAGTTAFVKAEGDTYWSITKMAEKSFIKTYIKPDEIWMMIHEIVKAKQMPSVNLPQQPELPLSETSDMANLQKKPESVGIREVPAGTTGIFKGEGDKYLTLPFELSSVNITALKERLKARGFTIIEH